MTTLSCPRCHGEYLHHRQVLARWRDEEDAPGLEVSSALHHTAKQRVAKGFRGRRDDVEILLSCEDCNGLSRLVVMQHKGQTLIWLELPEAPRF